MSEGMSWLGILLYFLGWIVVWLVVVLWQRKNQNS